MRSAQSHRVVSPTTSSPTASPARNRIRVQIRIRKPWNFIACAIPERTAAHRSKSAGPVLLPHLASSFSFSFGRFQANRLSVIETAENRALCCGRHRRSPCDLRRRRPRAARHQERPLFELPVHKRGKHSLHVAAGLRDHLDPRRQQRGFKDARPHKSGPLRPGRGCAEHAPTTFPPHRFADPPGLTPSLELHDQERPSLIKHRRHPTLPTWNCDSHHPQKIAFPMPTLNPGKSSLISPPPDLQMNAFCT